MLCTVKVPGTHLVISILALLSIWQTDSLAQPEAVPGQPRAVVQDDGRMETYDRGKLIDKVDIPGRVLASKQIIRLTEDLVAKPKFRHLPTGPDYIMDVDIDGRIPIAGIVIGIKGESKQTDVMFEGKSRTVVVHTNTDRGASLEVLVFLNGIPKDENTNTLDEKPENAHIAKHVVAQAFKKWESEKATLTIGYVHFVYREQGEEFGDKKENAE